MNTTLNFQIKTNRIRNKQVILEDVCRCMTTNVLCVYLAPTHKDGYNLLVAVISVNKETETAECVIMSNDDPLLVSM